MATLQPVSLSSYHNARATADDAYYLIVAESVKGGVEEAGGTVTIYQCVPQSSVSFYFSC